MDELATKALGLLAVDGAILALLADSRRELSSIWALLAVLALVAAGGFLLATIWPQQQFNAGPDPTGFYETFGNESGFVASQQMLVHLSGAFEENAPKLARRNLTFNRGFVLLVAGLLAAIVSVLASSS